jgi:hypothetical protein
MRRKIAAILVAHIADYGRLVADDEERDAAANGVLSNHH